MPVEWLSLHVTLSPYPTSCASSMASVVIVWRPRDEAPIAGKAARRAWAREPQLVETESADHPISERDLDMAHAVDRDGRDIVLAWRGGVSSVASDRTPRDICFDGGVVRVNAQYSPNGWHAAPTP